LARRGLMFERFGELARARLHLVEQPQVLDCDHRLVGERRDQFYLLVGKRPHCGSLQDDDADRSAFAEERDPKRCAHIELPVKHYVVRISPNIWGMDDLAFEKGSSRHRAPTRGDRIIFHVPLVLGGVAVRREMLEEFSNWTRKSRPLRLA